MSEITGQPQCSWWDRDDPSQAPSIEDRKWDCDSVNNTENPFKPFIGNAHAVRRLNRAAFAALGRFNHECSDCSFALIGPPSTGKATLARMFADLLDLPFVDIPAHNCQSLTDVALHIAEVCERYFVGEISLALRELGDRYLAPPLIIFIEDVHALPKKVEQGLGKAIHGVLTTEAGILIDISQVCWIVSTTDSDLLTDSFDSITKIHLKPLGTKDIAQVIAIHNPDWKPDICQIVAQHINSPREALAFVKEMRLEQEMNGGSWLEVAEVVAKDLIDQKTMPWVNRLRRNSRN